MSRSNGPITGYRKMLLILTLAALLAAPLLGQSQLASITGIVTDTSGAVIPGVTVKVDNADTGESWTSETNPTGLYTILAIKPGPYRLSADSEGFKGFRQTGIVLETGRQARLDIEMEVGSVTDSVTVEAAVPLLKSESAAIGMVVDNQTITNMPLINRRAMQLIRLSSNVVSSDTDKGRASIAGGRGSENNWLVDGGTVQNVSVDTPEPFFDPPIESLQEFNMSTSNYAAELGRTGGAVIQLTTRSGTNSFHGSGYYYVRNDAFDARTFFANEKEKLRYHLFGVSLGGPIVKNKTHFFFNYEGLRNKVGRTRIQSVPTRAETLGNFSANSGAVLDPLTGQPFPGNVIPSNRLDPVGAALGALYPEPNVPNRPSRSNNYRAEQITDQPSDNFVARVDHVFGEKDRLYGRFLGTDAHNDRGPIFPTPGIDSFNQFVDGPRYANLSGTWFRNLTSTFFNEFRMSYVNRAAPQWHQGLDSGMVDEIGLQGTNPRLFPRVNVTGLTRFGNGNRQLRIQDPIRSWVFQNNTTKIHGNHTIKFGFQYQIDRNDDVFQGTGGGSFSFNNVATKDALASLLLGWATNGSRQETPLIRSRADYYAAFIQDDWKITPKFTLNIGLRWDIDQPRWEAIDNRQNSFDRNMINPVSGTPGAVRFSGRDGEGKYAHNWDLNNFGPRIGFAWRITDKWVVRGGGAVSYVGAYNNNVAFDPSLGFGIKGNFVSPDNGKTPAFLLRDGLPAISAPSESELTPGFGAVAVGEKPTTSVLFLENGDRPNGYSEMFSLSVQRQLGSTMLMEAGYQGRLSHKIAGPSPLTINQVRPELMGPGNAQINRPFPQFSGVSVMIPGIGNSNYHALNLSFEKRYSGGLHFRAGYTWSKFIDDIEARRELGGGANGFVNVYDRAADRGPSGNDVKHRFVWSSVYELPIGAGKAVSIGNPVLNTIIGGWSLAYIVDLRTGVPYGVIEQTNRTNAFSPGQRPNVVGDPKISGDRPRAEQIAMWFDTSAFAQPDQYTFGNAGRAAGYGPGAIGMDLSVLKDFKFAERHSLQFRVEMLNFINNPNFNLPNTSRGNRNFGQINALAPGGNQARIIQFGLHYKF